MYRHSTLQSCLPSRSTGPHPGRSWVTSEVLSPLFPAGVQPWEMPSAVVGLAGSAEQQSHFPFRDEACTLLPGSVAEQKLTLCFSCAPQGGSGVPRLQGGTYNASATGWRDLLRSRVGNPLWSLHCSHICARDIQSESRSELCSTLSLSSTTCWFEQLSGFSGTAHVHISLSTMSTTHRKGKVWHEEALQLVKAGSLLPLLQMILWSNE